MRKLKLLVFLCLITQGIEAQENNTEYIHRIPAGENSWVKGVSERGVIRENGIRNWNDLNTKFNSYVRLNSHGNLHLGLQLRTPNGPSTLKITLNNESREITINNPDYKDLEVGTFTIENQGYQLIKIEALEKKGTSIAEIGEILVGGPATENGINYVKDNFHFGRRGPSVHLRYPIPEESKKPTYFYNEIRVPEGEDVIGSYYMANGFSHGYFGMQVNSKNERRILFSVWSPYDTQDPKEIPEDQKIVMLNKGDDVYTGEFGNEGSGGQSFKKFMWKTNTTYKFLLKGEPAGPNHTDYSAFFYAPEKEKWELIASFRRPKSSNYLGNLYSFLENFVPATGDISRKAHYKNQWIYDKELGWLELSNAIFTADATANQKHRLDYAGGEIKGGYYLKNCGFFNDYTEVNSQFIREPQKNEPRIDLKKLENHLK